MSEKSVISHLSYLFRMATATCLAVTLTSALALAEEKKEAAPATSTKPDSSAAKKSGAAPGAKETGDRLDVSDLENKYWSAKDTSFTVVQNRTYSKAKRFGVAASYASLVNDSFSTSPGVSLTGSYFFTERYGVEVSHLKASPQNNGAIKGILDLGQNTSQIFPDFGRVTAYTGVNFNWVPFYAKMSFLESKILYFDMIISPGLGVTNYDQVRDTGNVGKSSVTFSLDVTQQIFLSSHFAIRLDYKNRWFSEDVIKYRKSQDSGAKSQTTANSLLQFGVTYFF